MTGNVINYFDNYSPVADIVVMACCFVFFILIKFAYIRKTKSFNIFFTMLILLLISAATNIIFHISINQKGILNNIVIYLFYDVYLLSIFANIYCFVRYVSCSLYIDDEFSERYSRITSCVYFILSVLVIVGHYAHFGFYIDEELSVHSGIPFFIIFYFLFVGFAMLLLYKYRDRVFGQVTKGLVSSIVVSAMMLVIQVINDNTTYTCASVLFPAYAIMYLLHSSPYDMETGAVNEASFNDMIEYSYGHDTKLVIMSLNLIDFDNNNKLPREVQYLVKHFYTRFLKNAVLFRPSNGRLIVTFDVEKNPNKDECIKNMLNSFHESYPKYKLDYKIVIMESTDAISRNNEYIRLIKYIEKMKLHKNQVRIVNGDDIKAYLEHRYILSELEDINRRFDLDDSRIEVFCQPVLNTTTGKYDTAEALMRLRLKEVGMVFPDQFIPLAENYNLIHVLSLIILNKTCKKIKELMDEGYELNRISVNFSVIDVRDDNFCGDIMRIVKNCGIPYDKIAIEITESRNENDFEIVKEKIYELKDNGIKFYLDDFGTGYSNFERIIELPFDIIKFDRSLVIASGKSERSGTMVNSLASMFDTMNYSVLYEGVEDEKDEDMCKSMYAKYLQGYKYSKPIPIDKLKEYFKKSA
ncbi:MAG: EAL domain-containing protein [Lachnospiraceae bacterium]|nr:EAL domain-containing protein [Lachnospiraceae bacterium]